MKKVLLSEDNDNRSFLSIVRSLGSKGIVVHTLNSVQHTNTNKSRYIKKRIYIANQLNKPNHWKNNFIQLLEKENYTLVIPCDDLSDIALQTHREDFIKHAPLYLLEPDIYHIVKNKHKTTQLAASLNISVPKSELINEKFNLEDIGKKFSFPLVLKPISSFDENSLERHNVTIIYDFQSLNTELNSMLMTSPVQIQSFFEGVGIAVSLLANKGEILVATQHKRLHETFTGGGSSYRKSMPLNSELVDASKKIVEKLRYTGIAMFEFRYNMESSKWVLLEINGRFWGSLPLAISSGVDYPYLLYLKLTNKNLTIPKILYKPNKYQRNLESDMQWLNDALFNTSSEELKKHGYTKKSIILETFRLLSFRDNIDSFSIKDLCPFIIEIRTIFKQVSYLIIKKIRLRTLQNKYIRGIIKKILIVKLSKAKNILFICKGNICRSPFAQQAAKKLWRNIPVINSSGYYKKINRDAPLTAVNSALKFDIDLSKHQSSSLKEDDVKQADIIFYFDEENRKLLHEKFAIYKHKMYALGLLSDSSSSEIEDPIDLDENGFLETYDKIFNLLKYAI